jgi:hypothetical protein
MCGFGMLSIMVWLRPIAAVSLDVGGIEYTLGKKKRLKQTYQLHMSCAASRVRVAGKIKSLKWIFEIELVSGYQKVVIPVGTTTAPGCALMKPRQELR